MGAPKGNCNAAKNKSACKAKKGKKVSEPKKWVNGKLIGYKKMRAKGWYKKSGGRSILKTIKRLAHE